MSPFIARHAESLRFGLPLIVFGACILAACQSQVTIAGAGGEGGVGGAATGVTHGSTTATSSSVGTGSTASNSQCGNNTAVTMTTSAVVGSTGSGSEHCMLQTQDDMGHEWKSECEASGCNCLLDDVLVCACSVESSWDCHTSCCPAPWLPKAPF